MTVFGVSLHSQEQIFTDTRLIHTSVYTSVMWFNTSLHVSWQNRGLFSWPQFREPVCLRQYKYKLSKYHLICKLQFCGLQSVTLCVLALRLISTLQTISERLVTLMWLKTGITAAENSALHHRNKLSFYFGATLILTFLFVVFLLLKNNIKLSENITYHYIMIL